MALEKSWLVTMSYELPFWLLWSALHLLTFLLSGTDFADLWADLGVIGTSEYIATGNGREVRPPPPRRKGGEGHWTKGYPGKLTGVPLTLMWPVGESMGCQGWEEAS